MTERPVQQDEDLRPRTIWRVGIGIVVTCVALIAIAWLLVVPPRAGLAPGTPSPLEHGLVDRATGARDLQVAGERKLSSYAWIDRAAGLAHIPIEQAIDAVIVDPSLIAQPARSLP